MDAFCDIVFHGSVSIHCRCVLDLDGCVLTHGVASVFPWIYTDAGVFPWI